MKTVFNSLPTGREASALFDLARVAPEITWPNDCPHCAAPMEFDLTLGAKAARRICPQGHAITAADVLQRAKDEAGKDEGRRTKDEVAPLPPFAPAAA
jgi:hypothetical protein